MKVAARDQFQADLFKCRPTCNTGVSNTLDAADRGDVFKDLILVSKFAKERIGKELPASIGHRILAANPLPFPEQDQLIWLMDG